MRGHLRQAGLTGALPLVLLCALTLLFSLATRADAAMVLKDAAAPIKSVCSATGPLVDGGCILDATPAATKTFALTDLDLIGRGGDLLAGTASSALRAAESITPVPLPAAAWLLAMGLGGLGLMGRRRREALPGLRGEDGVEPLAATLRNSARTEAADHRRAPVRLDGFRRLIDAFRDSCLNATRPHAFAPGQSSPRRPNGGAGMLWAATAKRGPPAGDATQARRRRHSRAGRRARVFRLSHFNAPARLDLRPSRAFFSCARRFAARTGPRAGAGLGASGIRQHQERVEPAFTPRPSLLVRETGFGHGSGLNGL